MNDNKLLEVVNSKDTKIIKQAIFEAFKDYDFKNDIYYAYLQELENVDICKLTVPLCRAYIKILIDKDGKDFKNTSIEDGTIHKVLRRFKTIYDMNVLLSNKNKNEIFFKIMDFHGWYDRDYTKKLKYGTKEKPINSDVELQHIEEADFSYLTTLLTMLVRENNSYDDLWHKKRIPSGAIDVILTKMIYFILNGSYFDIEDDINE